MTGKKPPEGPPARGRRDRKVTADEASLWAQVTATVGPAKGKPHVRQARVAPEANAAVGLRRGEPRQAQVLPPMPELPAKAATKPAQAARPKAPPIAEFDRRKVRHIASGKIEIDARLDLHGLRQGEARQRLIGFICSAQQRGLRTVLVITGKGAAASADPLAGALGEPQRGVLRRLVPQWLDGPDLRAVVISFTTAAMKHGGEGALYVRLRRADRT